jgi:phosphate:Na+ symporter
MFLLEEAIHNLSGRTFRVSLRRYTDTPIKAILTGTLATAILQSSSAVTLMVLAFTGAGIMSLPNAIGVVFGSNLGTTFTSWLVAMLGFKLSIEALALPFIGVGGLGLIFVGKSARGGHFSKLAVGFGFLFMGLDYLRRGAESLMTAETLQLVPELGAATFVLAGFILTAAVQSSSASMAVILSVLHGGALDYSDAAAMVIGSNLGTTITAMIGAVGGSTVKRRVAAGHFLFNSIMAVIAFLLLPYVSSLIFDSLGFAENPLLGLALFHTAFNFMGVLLFERLIPEREVSPATFISKTTSHVPEAALVSLQHEVRSLIFAAMSHNEQLLGAIQDDTPAAGLHRKRQPPPDESYAELKQIQEAIYLFAAQLPGQEMTADEALLLNRLLSAVRGAIGAAKTLKDVRHEIDKLDTSECDYLNDRRRDLCRRLVEHHAALRAAMASTDPTAMAKLIQSMQTLMNEDSVITQETMHGLSSGAFNAEHISVLIATNRAFTLSARQMLFAIKDLTLGTEESRLFETFDLSGA